MLIPPLLPIHARPREGLAAEDPSIPIKAATLHNGSMAQVIYKCITLDSYTLPSLTTGWKPRQSHATAAQRVPTEASNPLSLPELSTPRVMKTSPQHYLENP